MIGAREILARMQAWYPGIDVAPFPGELRVQLAPGGDLARILALEDRFREERFDWAPASARSAREVADASGGPRSVTVMECVACSGPRVVMNHDSFAENLAHFLFERFRRTVLVEGTRLDRALIERERPDIVIQEFVERALMCPDLRGCCPKVCYRALRAPPSNVAPRRRTDRDRPRSRIEVAHRSTCRNKSPSVRVWVALRATGVIGLPAPCAP